MERLFFGRIIPITIAAVVVVFFVLYYYNSLLFFEAEHFPISNLDIEEIPV